MSKKSLYDKFLDEHLPKVPNFVEENVPKFDPGFTLGPPIRGAHEKNFLEAYFNNDPRHLVVDAYHRPEHYTAEQKEILGALEHGKPLPPGTTSRDINEIVLRFLEKTEHRKKREAIVQKVQKALESEKDPTVARILAGDEPSFENQGMLPKAIKII